MGVVQDVRDWLVVNKWWLLQRYRRFMRAGPYAFEPGSYAVITFGPSAGTVVRLERRAYMPPGCSGQAIHRLQPWGPVWVVDKFLEWDVERPAGLGVRRYRFTTAPWTALRAAGELDLWHEPAYRERILKVLQALIETDN